MLPPLRQRLLVTVCVLVGGLLWMRVESGLLPSTGGGGIALIDAGVGVIGGVFLVLLGGLVAIAGAVLCGAVGNPLATPFVFASALLFLAADGGRSLGFLWRSTPGDYVPLLIEAFFWFALLAGTLWLSAALRAPLRRRLPWLVNDHRPRRPLLHGFTDPTSLLAAVVCAAVAGVLAHLMIRSWDVGQVLGALVFAFAVGGLIAQVVTPTAAPGPLLFSPLLLAGYGYLQTWLSYGQADALLTAAYRADGGFSDLSGLAWTLPIHFASAAVAGAALGAGIAQGLLHADRRPRADASPAAEAVAS